MGKPEDALTRAVERQRAVREAVGAESARLTEDRAREENERIDRERAEREGRP